MTLVTDEKESGSRIVGGRRNASTSALSPSSPHSAKRRARGRLACRTSKNARKIHWRPGNDDVGARGVNDRLKLGKLTRRCPAPAESYRIVRRGPMSANIRRSNLVVQSANETPKQIGRRNRLLQVVDHELFGRNQGVRPQISATKLHVWRPSVSAEEKR
jgi:hypothetical protein